MGQATKIEWAANADGSPGATWNPIRARRIDAGPHHGMTGTHCVHASEGCRNCYAERWNNRALPGAGTGLPYAKQSEAKLEIFLDEKLLVAPLRRRKPTTWFLSSMSDVFADFVTDAMLDRLFAVMALSPQHTFIVLTKRAKRMREFMDCHTAGSMNGKLWSFLGSPLGSKIKHGGNWRVAWPIPNVWLGVSAEDQKTADERIPDLLATPAAIRLLSAEPLLGAMDLTRSGRNYLEPFETDNNGPILPGLDWVIVGGESQTGARPMHPDWARSLRDQCVEAGVPFFFKQWGEWAPLAERSPDAYWPADTTHACRISDHGTIGCADGWPMQRVGKARAGRLLDGMEHNARPPLSTADKGEARLPATGTASPGRSAP